MSTVQARAATVTVKFSQMPIQQEIEAATLVPALYRGLNVMAPAGAIAALVTKDSIGLSNVQNIAPADMPISDLTAQALARKMDVDAVIPISRVTGLETALSLKLDTDGVIEQNQVTGLNARLQTLETGPIALERVQGFDAGVNAVIDGRTDVVNTVNQGATGW